MSILSRLFQLKESPVAAEMRAHQEYVNEIRCKMTTPKAKPPGPAPTGGPAFARGGMHSVEHCYLDQGAEGMTLRDYAAIAAMQGVLASIRAKDAEHLWALLTGLKGSAGNAVAETAYNLADAMLNAREP